MGRGESDKQQFDVLDVVRVGFSSDLPDLSAAAEKRAVSRLQELTDSVLTQRADSFDGAVLLTDEQERFFSDPLLRRKLIERPLSEEADDFYRAVIESAVRSDSEHGLVAYLRLSADRVGLLPSKTPHIALAYNADRNLVCHLRASESATALCGAELNGPIPESWRPRGTFKRSAGSGHHCLDCLQRSLDLDPSDPTRLAAEEGDDYPIADEKEIQGFYEAIRDNMLDILELEPNDPDHFLAVFLDPVEPQTRAINWMKQYLIERFYRLPERQRVRSIFKNDDSNLGFADQREHNLARSLLVEIELGRDSEGQKLVDAPWPEDLDEVTAVFEEAIGFSKRRADHKRLVFLGALAGRCWPTAAEKAEKRFDPYANDASSMFFDALRLYRRDF